MRLLIITQKVDKEDDVLGFFHNWIEKISSNVSHVTVIALAVGTHNLPANVTVYSLGKEKGAGKIIKALRFFCYAITVLPKVDGVFVHMAPEYVRALYPFNIFFRKPIIMWYAHIHVSAVAGWALTHVHKVMTPSKESFILPPSLEQYRYKIVSTGHGIDTNIFFPGEHYNKGTIVSFSRISKVKKIEILIEALSIFQLKYPELPFSVHIYGTPARPEDSEYLHQLRTLVETKKLTEYIVWQGSLSNYKSPQMYRNADIFVRMQGGGGFGKTELEAMSCGVPAIVCTDVYKTLLGEFADDLYFKDGDTQGLAECLHTVLLWDTHTRNEYSKVARSIVVDGHNLENLAKTTVNLFKECV